MSPVKFQECPDCTDMVRVKNDGSPYKHQCDKPVVWGTCEACGCQVPVTGEGVLAMHFRDVRNPDSVCPGSPAAEPLPESSGPAPFGGDEEPETCGGCGETEDRHGGIESACYWSPVREPDGAHDKWCGGGDEAPCVHYYVWGDDGHGHSGSFCLHCDQEEPVSEPPATVESMDDTPKQAGPAMTMREIRIALGHKVDDTPKPDPFDTPATVDKDQEPEINVSGQPEPKRDQWGRYLLPHPVTGVYSDGKDKPNRRNGWMRATTFAKLAADTFSLTRYNERLTLLGATLRPDVVALAHGKHVKRDNKELNRLVTQVKETAGAKVAANIGTAVHGFTERVDAGLCGLEGVPEEYRRHVASYLEELEKYGLETVPGLIERTTLVDEWGKVVVGTFDRVLYHRASGTYLIGDLKTGETLEWGKMEIAVQLALYAHGINAHGVYDWAAEWWALPGGYLHRGAPDSGTLPKVRTDWGVVMHLPIQGPNAGVCTLRRVNLAAGWDAAAVSAGVDTSRKRDDYMDDWEGLPVAPYAPELPEQIGNEPMPWEGLFALVQSKQDASDLWSRAKEAGVDRMELKRLVEIAQQRLRVLGVSG